MCRATRSKTLKVPKDLAAQQRVGKNPSLMVAWPAQYGVSGIQTFRVNQDGIVYQTDLVPETKKTAASSARYNPDKTWIETEDEP
jgi:hypothetical protein